MNGDEKRLPDLVERYLQGTLDAPGREELHGLLEKDATARAFFAEQLTLSTLLSETYQARDFTIETVDRILAGDAKPEPAARQDDTRQISTRHVRRLRRTRLRDAGPGAWIPALIAAGVLIGFTLLIFTASPGPEQLSTPVERPIARPEPAPVPQPRPEVAPPPVVSEEVVLREEERKQAEAELARIRKEKAELRRKLAEAGRRKQEELKRKAEEMMPRIREQQAAAERRLARAKEEERRARESAPSTPALPGTAPAIASFQVLSGEAHLLRTDGTRAATSNSVREGEAVETVGPDSRAALVFTDGTRVEVGPDSKIRDLSVQAKARRAGKWITLERGSLAADVTRQKLGQPMKIGTVHGDATVLGTSLRISVEPDGMRLEVTKGRVRLRRATDGKRLVVFAGHFALAGAGVKLVAKRLVAPLLFTDDFSSSTLNQWPKGWRHHQDTGRSGFQVRQDAGTPTERHIVPAPGSGGKTQHAFIPVDRWGPAFEVTFRMRLTGPGSTRVGIELEDGFQIPAFEYDHAAGVLRAAWPRAPQALQQIPAGSTRVPFKLAEGRWHSWKVTVRNRSVTVAVNGSVLLRAEIPQLKTVSRSSLISQGSDGTQFSQVRVFGPRPR